MNGNTLFTPTDIAKYIYKSLTVAYGGYSQFGFEEIAAALIGQVNNGLLAYDSTEKIKATKEALLLLESERWELDPIDLSSFLEEAIDTKGKNWSKEHRKEMRKKLGLE